MIPVTFATQNRFCLEKCDYPNVDISSKMDLLIRCEHLFSLLRNYSLCSGGMFTNAPDTFCAF